MLMLIYQNTKVQKKCKKHMQQQSFPKQNRRQNFNNANKHKQYFNQENISPSLLFITSPVPFLPNYVNMQYALFVKQIESKETMEAFKVDLITKCQHQISIFTSDAICPLTNGQQILKLRLQRSKKSKQSQNELSQTWTGHIFIKTKQTKMLVAPSNKDWITV